MSLNAATLSLVPVDPMTPMLTSSPMGTVTDMDDFTLTCTTASTTGMDLRYIFIIDGVQQPQQTSNMLTLMADINNVQTYSCIVVEDGNDNFSEMSNEVTLMGKIIISRTRLDKGLFFN